MDLYYAAWNTLSTTRSLVNEFECTDGLKWGESPLTVPVNESLIYTTDGSMKDQMIKEREKLFPLEGVTADNVEEYKKSIEE